MDAFLSMGEARLGIRNESKGADSVLQGSITWLSRPPHTLDQLLVVSHQRHFLESFTKDLGCIKNVLQHASPNLAKKACVHDSRPYKDQKGRHW
jgi:hypothetical protein